MPTYRENIERLTLPVIPMRGIVAFPANNINFELEREFSKNACQAATSGDMNVFLLTQKNVQTEEPSEEDLYSVGCVARIKQSVKNPKTGIIRVVAEGFCRGTVLEFKNADGYFSADILTKTVSADLTDRDLRVEAMLTELRGKMEEMLRYRPAFSQSFELAARSISNPGLLSDFIAAQLFVRFEDKQAVLEEYDPMRRAERTLLLMETELDLLQTELEIHQKVKQAMDDNQRDYYLREQLKAIEYELGMGEDGDELKKRMEGVKLPDKVREKLDREIVKLGRMSPGSPEAAVIYNYVDTCLNIPWDKKTKDRIDVDAARRILDADHDGLTKIKERILEFLAVKQLNPELKNQILCFVGPPGVGKTSLGASIARAMKRKYVRVSLGGIRDESDIRGHRKTYIGSMPGRIIDALTQCGSLNPVMLLDEVDKMCQDVHGDPASALLEVLDSEQNHAFRDHFIELPVDLSDVLFICTANTLDTVPRPLLDRMEVIELNTYTPTEKLSIAKNHLLPKQLKRHGLNRRMLKITDAAIEDLIEGFTRESGVRTLERELGALCRKGAKVLVEEGRKNLTIDKPDLEKYLGPRKFIDDGVSKNDLVGVTNGLAWTEVGGDLLKVEVLPVEGSGKIELTGQLGDVMKESAQIAVTWLRAHCAEYGIQKDFYKTKDIHIHVPEGAVPKDGPSAGVTMATSLVSALSGIPVRCDVAMTGEITLTGRVLAIGGLREKATAAWTRGIKTILVPQENMRDTAEMDSVIRDEVTFIPCTTLTDVLGTALAKPAPADVLPVIGETPSAEKDSVPAIVPPQPANHPRTHL
ncbi:MAG: endopeptidase La [Ruminococcaceae bacterium]|jgi:ATP-dependent Lon protease|nr:endopeptidase La [Oscillospiraceae bacterium]